MFLRKMKTPLLLENHFNFGMVLSDFMVFNRFQNIHITPEQIYHPQITF